jgi:disulfide bond formation protein DsbB
VSAGLLAWAAGAPAPAALVGGLLALAGSLLGWRVAQASHQAGLRSQPPGGLLSAAAAPTLGLALISAAIVACGGEPGPRAAVLALVWGLSAGDLLNNLRARFALAGLLAAEGGSEAWQALPAAVRGGSVRGGLAAAGAAALLAAALAGDRGLAAFVVGLALRLAILGQLAGR